VDFYSEVLLELMVALGGALFAANAFALARRGSDRRRSAKEAAVRARPGSPVRKQVRLATTGTLTAAPLARSLTFMTLGFVIAAWGIASLAR
jgi:hypothetical protein